MKKCISLILILAFCFSILVPKTIFAMHNIDNKSNTKHTRILKATDNEIIYTYEQNGEKYKNIDLIFPDQMSVNSKIYLLKGSEYILVDTIDSYIKGDTM